mmetsp:Transcript_11909/g.34890  ORF Transcript_11909/g.34890 Transcript_11909/m.34890 type:complete len:101 (-) Transcript_11909:2169-2471(-)
MAYMYLVLFSMKIMTYPLLMMAWEYSRCAITHANFFRGLTITPKRTCGYNCVVAVSSEFSLFTGSPNFLRILLLRDFSCNSDTLCVNHTISMCSRQVIRF